MQLLKKFESMAFVRCPNSYTLARIARVVINFLPVGAGLTHFSNITDSRASGAAQAYPNQQSVNFSSSVRKIGRACHFAFLRSKLSLSWKTNIHITWHMYIIKWKHKKPLHILHFWMPSSWHLLVDEFIHSFIRPLVIWSCHSCVHVGVGLTKFSLHLGCIFQ